MKSCRVLLFLMCLSFVFSACGGNQAKLEEARHLLASGSPSSAQKAERILEDLLDGATGEFRVEVVELYVGALLSGAGFNGISLIVNVLHREDDDNVAAVLRRVIDDEEGAIERLETAVSTMRELVGTLHDEEGDFAPNLEPTVRDSEEEAYDFTSIEPASDFAAIDIELKKRAYYMAGISETYRGLFLLLKLTGFDKDQDFDRDECEDFLTGDDVGTEGPDAISLAFFRGRAYLGKANFDDERLGADENNKIVKLADDLQSGTGSNTSLDPDTDGFIGEAGDPDQTQEAKARRICDYLEDSVE